MVEIFSQTGGSLELFMLKAFLLFSTESFVPEALLLLLLSLELFVPEALLLLLLS